MLPVKYRLHSEKDIKKTLRLGRSVYSPYFRLKYLKNDLDHPRITVVISAKVSKKSTIRNKLKRRIREIFHINYAKLSGNFDILASANSSALKLDYKQIEEDIKALLKKAKLLK